VGFESNTATELCCLKGARDLGPPPPPPPRGFFINPTRYSRRFLCERLLSRPSFTHDGSFIICPTSVLCQSVGR